MRPRWRESALDYLKRPEVLQVLAVPYDENHNEEQAQQP